MELGLYQTQSLKLVMTNELRQAITILQYPTLELTHFLRQQALENPLIDLLEKRTEPVQGDSQSDLDARDSWFYEEDDTNPINFLKAEDPSLQDHLIEQIAWLDISENERMAAEYMIYCLDENGYLDCSLERLQVELGIPEEALEHILGLVQQLEPAGVGARSLSECLLLQFDRIEYNNSVARTIIQHHLNDLADKKFTHIMKALQITKDELKQADELIRSLNPRPCVSYSQSRSEWVQPEFFIELDETGRYIIRMNEELVPEVTLNERYFRLMKGHHDAKAYLEKQLQKYEWLKRSLEQRRQTLTSLGEYLVQRQRDFFEYGYEALKPMTLREVADAIEVHESTVSRAVKNKTIQTPKGTIALKSLFSSKLDRGNDSEEASSTQVKVRIQQMIEEETKGKPLSDQKLADKLKSEGISISRRTVAKYREELGIASSSKRKALVV
ncbi:RNA polymerase factor sigma-54 [Pseudalkalibacillus sp. SCS-8]|uniref:RNA polymerase factor sigma-54 n=1 Tax=Pseudalkalibacillus nanhaiensis TaxID=3115291 RepID=UPI0032DB66BF